MIKHYYYQNKKFFEVQLSVNDPITRKRFQPKRRTDEEGRRITSMKMAKEVEFNLKLEYLAKNNGDYSRLPFAKWHESFLVSMRNSSFRDSTIAMYDGDLKKWMTEDFKSIPLGKISSRDVEKLIQQEMAYKGATAHTRKRILRNLSRVLEAACEDGQILKNPAKSKRIVVDIPVKVPKVLNGVEAGRLLEEGWKCNHKFYYVWAAALFTGMRSGELYGLRWDDVDLDSKIINVSRQWTNKDGYHTTKTNKTRVVPISEEFMELLIEMKRIGPFTEELKGLNGKRDLFHDLVFPRIPEWKYGQQSKVLKEFCKAIKLTEVKFHDLRATFITNLYSHGVSTPQVMSIVGHSKISTTEIYLRLAGVDIKDSTNKLSYKLPKTIASNVLNLR